MVVFGNFKSSTDIEISVRGIFFWDAYHILVKTYEQIRHFFIFPLKTLILIIFQISLNHLKIHADPCYDPLTSIMTPF